MSDPFQFVGVVPTMPADSKIPGCSANFPAWGLSETYDRYANRTAQSVTAGSGPFNSVSVSASTNRITDSGYGYDSSGNMTNDGLNTLVYDAENRLVSINSGSNAYAYDGNGLRVRKCAPNCSSPTSSTVYIFSGSKVIAEYDNGAAPNSPSREYIYAGSQLLAKIEGSVTKYYHQDHLSNRLITDSSGNVAEQKGHFPFGEDWYQGTDKLKFTTYERDSESGNDYAMARYHVNRLARFSSPDPISGDISDPQSLNRYAYVRNNPINLYDPLGLEWYCSFDLETQSRPAPWSHSKSSTVGASSDGDAVDTDDDDPQSSPEACARHNGIWVYHVDVIEWGGGGGGSIPPGACANVYQDGILIGTYCPGGAGPAGAGGGGSQGGGGQGGHEPPKAGPQTTGSRLACAANFGQNHSIAAAFGGQNNFVGNLLGGNSVSGILNLGMMVFGNKTPTGGDIASTILSGGGQGLPGGGPGFKGVGGIASDAIVGGAVSAGYNAIAGVGQQTLELGISASTVATPVAQLSAETLGTVASGVGLAKLAFDAATVLYGYTVACHQ